MEVMVIEKRAFQQLESQLNDLLAQAQKAVQAYPQVIVIVINETFIKLDQFYILSVAFFF